MLSSENLRRICWCMREFFSVTAHVCLLFYCCIDTSFLINIPELCSFFFLPRCIILVRVFPFWRRSEAKIVEYCKKCRKTSVTLSTDHWRRLFVQKSWNIFLFRDGKGSARNWKLRENGILPILSYILKLRYIGSCTSWPLCKRATFCLSCRLTGCRLRPFSLRFTLLLNSQYYWKNYSRIT
jgi:hypothetical protein